MLIPLLDTYRCWSSVSSALSLGPCNSLSSFVFPPCHRVPAIGNGQRPGRRSSAPGSSDHTPSSATSAPARTDSAFFPPSFRCRQPSSEQLFLSLPSRNLPQERLSQNFLYPGIVVRSVLFSPAVIALAIYLSSHDIS